MYTAKYLPVDGKNAASIKTGTLVPIFKNEKLTFLNLDTKDLFRKFMNLEGYKNGIYRPAKLFLVSTDLQIGDLAFAGNTEEYAGNVIDEADLKIWKEEYDGYKIIGEISPDAVWVKENDVFTEDQVRYVLLSPKNPDTFVSISEDWFMNNINQEFKRVQIKGPCGHYH